MIDSDSPRAWIHQVHENLFVFQENQKSGEIEKQRLAKIATMSIKMMQELSGNLLRKVRCQIDRKNDLAQLCYVVTYIGNRKGYFKIYYVFFGEVRITLTISTVVVSQ